MGKTTTAVNVAAGLALAGKYVLLVDIDPQANATSGVGIEHMKLERGIYESIIGAAPMRHIILPTKIKTKRIAPATLSLAGASVELVPLESREFKLAEAIKEVTGAYDYIIIDCPPSLGILTINGLVAANEILIPVQAEYYALEGLSQLLSTIELIRDNLKPELNVLGAVLTMFDKRNKLSEEVMSQLYQFFPNKIFRSVIPRTVKLAEAPSFGQSIFEYQPVSKGARAYERLVKEILDGE